MNELTIESELLSRYFSSLSRFVLPNPLIPAYEYVRMEVRGSDLYLTAGSSWATVTRRLPLGSDVSDGFGCCVEYAPVRKGLSTYRGPVTLRLLQNGSQALLTCGRSKLTIAVIPMIDYPTPRISYKGEGYTITAEQGKALAQSLKRVEPFTQKDDHGLTAFGYVWIVDRADKVPLVIGCSNSYMYTEPAPIPAAGFGYLGILSVGVPLFLPILLSSSPVTIFDRSIVKSDSKKKAAPDVIRNIDDMIQHQRSMAVDPDRNWLTMRTEYDTVSVIHSVEAQPTKIVPFVLDAMSRTANTHIAFNRADLLAVVGRVQALPVDKLTVETYLLWKGTSRLVNPPSERGYQIDDTLDVVATGIPITADKALRVVPMKKALSAMDYDRLVFRTNGDDFPSLLHFSPEGEGDTNFFFTNVLLTNANK